jgi:hypothetical protein
MRVEEKVGMKEVVLYGVYSGIEPTYKIDPR